MHKKEYMRSRVLFVVDSYHIGGTIVSLQSLLSVINLEQLQVDVYAASDEGSFRTNLPNCRVLSARPLLAQSSAGLSMIPKLCYKGIQLLSRLSTRFLKKDLRATFVSKGCRRLGIQQYDCVVCYSEQLVNYVSLFPARRKIAWIHCDYSRVVNDQNKAVLFNALNRYNQIVCVSEYARTEFVKIFPQFECKATAIHNIINERFIQQRANEINDLDSRFSNRAFKIVSIGRLDPIKQFHLIPRIAEQVLNESDPVFTWFIIGGVHGYDEEYLQIMNEINQRHLENIVVLLGEKQNIYPYIKNADLYVCTSKSESYPLVVNEAKALRVPIISNYFPSVVESVQDGKDGYVVKQDRIAETIVEHIRNPKLKRDGEVISENAIILSKIMELLTNKE